MDEKEEDVSEESFQKHVKFYKKLNKTILNIQNEIKNSQDEMILKHLKERIDAIELDKKRIKNMFKDKNDDIWDNL